MTVVFLSEAERERLNSFPSDIPPDDLTSFFTLTDADKQQLPIKSSSANRLGFALQLCTLRYLGFCPDTVAPAPLPAVIYVASQLGVSAHAWPPMANVPRPEPRICKQSKRIWDFAKQVRRMWLHLPPGCSSVPSNMTNRPCCWSWLATIYAPGGS